MSTTPASQHLKWWVYVVVFAAALAGLLRRNDVSPVVHPDTIFEEALVQECLRDDVCTTLGGSASVRGMFHMVGWLNFRVFAEWLGWGRDGVHLFIQVANAFRIVLVMLVADRLGGAPAAALAPYFALRTGAAPGALYDTSLMAFFGTVLLVQCVAAAVRRPSTAFLVLAALTAAVVAEVHLAGTMALLSVIWVTCLHPPGRIRRAAFVATAFVAAFLVISPKTVAWDLVQLFSHAGNASSGASQASDPLAVRLAKAAGGIAFLVPWMLHRLLAVRLGAPPRGLRGALAVCVPVALAQAVGVALGVLPSTSSHYLEHAYPAMAVVLAVPFGAIGARAWESAATAVAVPARARRALVWMLPLFLSLHAAWAQPGPERPQARWSDVGALAELLHDDWQWDWATVTKELHSPEKALILEDLSATVPGWTTPGQPTPRRPAEPIAVIAVDRRRVPDPLPSGWMMVSARMVSALLVVPTKSALDWSAHTACLEDAEGEETCFGPPVDPKLLWHLGPRVAEIRRFVRRVPWRGAPGSVEGIAMPALPSFCAGRIVAGPPGTSIDAGGRRARVTTPGDVTFEWLPDTPGCAMVDFRKQDYPLFVVAGDPPTVDAMIGIVEASRGTT